MLGIKNSKIQDIKTVRSHAQALSQCSKIILENNLIIKVGLSDSLPLGVDTEKDLEKISKEMKLL